MIYGAIIRFNIRHQNINEFEVFVYQLHRGRITQIGNSLQHQVLHDFT